MLLRGTFNGAGQSGAFKPIAVQLGLLEGTNDDGSPSGIVRFEHDGDRGLWGQTGNRSQENGDNVVH